MKSILRKTAINGLALFFVSQAISGFAVSGGLETYLIAGFLLGLISLVVRPILTILTLPLNLLTFGMFSFVINAFLLYLLTVLVPTITVSAFTFPGATIAGFVIPRIDVNTFFAYIVASFLVSLIVYFVGWLFNK